MSPEDLAYIACIVLMPILAFVAIVGIFLVGGWLIIPFTIILLTAIAMFGIASWIG